VERYRQLNSKHLEPICSEYIGDESMYLKVRTSQSEIYIALAARTQIFVNGRQRYIKGKNFEEEGYVARQFKVDVEKGEDVRIEKVISLHTSRDHAITECGIESRNAVQNAEGFEALLATHILAWDHLWRRFEVSFQNNAPEIDHSTEMVLRLYTFHLLQSVSIHTMDLDVGVPSRGWHGEAYRGHIFWDELFIFPFLNLRVPEITRSLLMYRYRRLKEARKAALMAGYRGAMYPWQSGSNGREESQQVHLNPKSGRWIPDNSSLQRHVNSAIVYNICKYYEVTGDMEFLSFYGAEMVMEIARFWASISSYNIDLDKYEILGVMGPDEYHESYPDKEKQGLNNNAYTNIMAVWVLGEALRILKILPEDRARELRETIDLREDELELWGEITKKMRLVFHDDGIISQFEGYEELQEFDWEGYRQKYGDIQRLDRILKAEDDNPNRYKASKQADVLMLFYLFSSEELRNLFDQLGHRFEYETIPKNIRYYMDRTSHGSTLSRVVHSWVLIRSDRARSWLLFNEALESDISDIQGGTTPEGIHLGAMAGSVNILMEGYTGIETRGEVLWFNPCLPKDMQNLSMCLRYRGHALQVNITSETLKISSIRCTKDPITIGLNEQTFRIKGGESKTFSLKK
jgi:alpha,alpha-trehalase